MGSHDSYPPGRELDLEFIPEGTAVARQMCLLSLHLSVHRFDPHEDEGGNPG